MLHIDCPDNDEGMTMPGRCDRQKNQRYYLREITGKRSSPSSIEAMVNGTKRTRCLSVTSASITDEDDWTTPKQGRTTIPNYSKQTRYATRRAAVRTPSTQRRSSSLQSSGCRSNSVFGRTSGDRAAPGSQQQNGRARRSHNGITKSSKVSNKQSSSTTQIVTRSTVVTRSRAKVCKKEPATRTPTAVANDESGDRYKNLYERVKNRERRNPRDLYHVSRYEEAQRHNRYDPFRSLIRNGGRQADAAPVKRRRRSRGCLSWMSTSSSPSSSSEDALNDEDGLVRSSGYCSTKGAINENAKQTDNYPKTIKKKADKRNRLDRANLKNAPSLFNNEQHHQQDDYENIKLDKRITFASVGGHEASIRVLKEMIIFPLMYEEIFTRFKIKPPRGVLFHGPPGTGKTLLARALANECSNGPKKISFFMRKGADCLSKWVGESERQLKNIFEKAQALRPSIIFFDEIDGLAPVRSSRQDQIHTSIVSTLLALMDGVDNDSGVVIVGATNRLDFIDPALRRPGRFDREFFFGLPKMNVREAIIRIHTGEWENKPTDEQIQSLAERTNGFCGADLEALCRDSVLRALRRTYPQVYKTNKRLRLNPEAVEVTREDFEAVLATISSSVMRTSSTYAIPLPNDVKCLLQQQTDFIQASIVHRFPVFGGCQEEPLVGVSIHQHPQLLLTTFRPRVIISGNSTSGISTYIAPALLHNLETNVYAIDPEIMFSPNWNSPEQAITNQFRVGSRNIPSIVYLPKIDSWWDQLNDSAQVMLVNCVEKLDPRTPLLLLATADCEFDNIPDRIRSLFDRSSVFETSLEPNRTQRVQFITEIFENDLTSLFSGIYSTENEGANEAQIEACELVDGQDETLPEKTMSELELAELWEREEAVMMSLRLFIREMLSRFVHDRRFVTFRSPVDPSSVPDYYDIIKKPVDLSLIMSKIDKHNYFTVDQFLDDIKQLLRNANMYNPDASPADRELRHKAGHLLDFALSTVRNELHTGSHEEVKRIFQSRLARGAVCPLPVRYILYRGGLPVDRNGTQSPSNSMSAYANKVFIRFEPVIPVNRSGQPICLLREDEYNVQQSEPGDDNPMYRRILTIEPNESNSTCYFECIPSGSTTSDEVRQNERRSSSVNNNSPRRSTIRSRASSAASRKRDVSVGAMTAISGARARLSKLSQKCCLSDVMVEWSLDRLQQFKSRILAAASLIKRDSSPVVTRLHNAIQAIEMVVDEYCSGNNISQVMVHQNGEL